VVRTHLGRFISQKEVSVTSRCGSKLRCGGDGHPHQIQCQKPGAPVMMEVQSMTISLGKQCLLRRSIDIFASVACRELKIVRWRFLRASCPWSLARFSSSSYYIAGEQIQLPYPRLKVSSRRRLHPFLGRSSRFPCTRTSSFGI